MSLRHFPSVSETRVLCICKAITAVCNFFTFIFITLYTMLPILLSSRGSIWPLSSHKRHFFTVILVFLPILNRFSSVVRPRPRPRPLPGRSVLCHTAHRDLSSFEDYSSCENPLFIVQTLKVYWVVTYDTYTHIAYVCIDLTTLLVNKRLYVPSLSGMDVPLPKHVSYTSCFVKTRHLSRTFDRNRRSRWYLL